MFAEVCFFTSCQYAITVGNATQGFEIAIKAGIGDISAAAETDVEVPSVS